MRKYVLYCDRCANEGTETVAVTMVWIRTGGVGGTVRSDVCAEHLALIVGAPASSNGASAPQPAALPRGRIYNALLAKLRAYAAKHPRFSLDDAALVAGGSTRVHVVTRYLVNQGELERVVQGVFQTPGYKMPTPTLDAGADAVAKLVKAQPGIRSSYLGPVLGMDNKQWKKTLAILRDKSLVRTKGTKSAMRLYPKT
jgi:hypothetical protein